MTFPIPPPPPEPLPISMMLILSMPASCVAKACASSGILSTTMLMHGRLVELLPGLGLLWRPSASASSFFLTTSASASPTASTFAASARPILWILAASPAPSNSSSFWVASARMIAACFSPFGAEDRRLPLGLGGPDDRGQKLLLPPGRLLLLDRDLLLLADLLDPDLLLGDLLPRDRGGERPGLLRLGLLGLHHSVELGLLRLLVAHGSAIATSASYRLVFPSRSALADWIMASRVA